MSNREVNELAKALAKIRLDREQLIRALDNTNKQESRVLKKLVKSQTAAAAAAAAIAKYPKDKNPYKKGDLLQIANSLRRELGITGVVIRSGATFVTIRNTDTGKSYTRAWWNLNKVN